MWAAACLLPVQLPSLSLPPVAHRKVHYIRLISDAGGPSPRPSSPADPYLQTPMGSSSSFVEDSGITISISFTASGDVSDYTDDMKATILDVLSVAAGLDAAPNGATLDVTAASVNVVATIPMASEAAAEAATSAFNTAVGSASDLQALLSAAGVDITVESDPTINAEVAEPTGVGSGPDLTVILPAVGGGLAVFVVGIFVAYRKRMCCFSGAKGKVATPRV